MNSPPQAEVDDSAQNRWQVVLAMFGLLVSVLVILVRGDLTLTLSHNDATAFGLIGFASAITAPFMVLIGATFTWPTPNTRPILLGTCIVTLLLGIATLFSFGVLYFGVAVGLGWLWWSSRATDVLHSRWISAGLTTWMVLTLVISIAALFVRTTPKCWDTTKSKWVTVGATNPTHCTSDIIDNTEGALSIAFVLVGVAGIWLISRLIDSSPGS